MAHLVGGGDCPGAPPSARCGPGRGGDNLFDFGSMVFWFPILYSFDKPAAERIRKQALLTLYICAHGCIYKYVYMYIFVYRLAIRWPNGRVF